MAVSDPTNGLQVAWAGNTMPGRWAWRLAPIQCLLWCLVIGLLRTTARWADSPAGCR